MQRIEHFLDENEVPEWASSMKTSENGSYPVPDHRIGFEQAYFEWHGLPKAALSPSRFRLGPLNIYFPRGKLTLVSGATGSGKSALLAALLGEMHCTSGSVHIDKMDHRVAYCAQSPCQSYLNGRVIILMDILLGLEHATIRDNIIFGSKSGYDEARYQAVIEACALIPDLKILDAGDLTGEI